MGKKSFTKKKTSDNKSSNKKQPQLNDSVSSSTNATNATNPISDNNNYTRPSLFNNIQNEPANSDEGGIYNTYKKCTESVKQWAILSWQQGNFTSDDDVSGSVLKNKNKKKTTKKLPKLPLSTIISNLIELAKRNTIMPSQIFNNLKIAIRLRRQASLYYNVVTVNAGTSFCEGHQWIINQLVLVYEAFRDAAHRIRVQQQLNTNTCSGGADMDMTSMENRFAALGTDNDVDDDDDDSTLQDELHSNNNNNVQQIPTTTTTTTPSTSPPNEELVQEEERHFAIACALLEVEKLRQHIGNTWKDWAATVTENTTTATDVGKGLVSASTISRYAILMVKSSIMSTCVEFDAFNDFDNILKTRQTPYVRQNANFELGQTVIITGLVAKPEFNDQCGTVCTVSNDNDNSRDHRYGVRLDNGKVIAVKPVNLLLSDNLLVGLNQVYDALSNFNFNTVPIVDQTIQAPQHAVKCVCVGLLGSSFDTIEYILHCRDRRALLQIMIKHYLPLWIAFSDYGGSFGPADSLFRAYLADFRIQRTIQFHWAVLLLCITDCCFDCYSVNKNSHEIATNSMEALLLDLSDINVYQMAIDVLDSGDGKSAGLWSHRQTIHDIRSLWSPMTTFFPWISADQLMQGLRLHFVAASGLPYQFWKEYTTLLHLYSMLRQEGYVTVIPEIDDTLIRMYRKHVFFRSGVPESGTESYISSWQVSVGVNIQSVRAIKGDGMAHRGAGVSKHAENRTGLHVTEMSRLLAIIQWQDVRVQTDPKVCFDEIHKVVCDEFDTLFLAPLMKTSIKMNRLDKLLVTRCGREPLAFCERWVGDYERILSQFKPAPAVCFWALALADGRSLDVAEVQRGLQMVANCFGEVFGQWCLVDSSSSRTISCSNFTFNPNDHIVSSTRWGDKGAKKYCQLNKL